MFQPVYKSGSTLYSGSETKLPNFNVVENVFPIVKNGIERNNVTSAEKVLQKVFLSVKKFTPNVYTYPMRG